MCFVKGSPAFVGRRVFAWPRDTHGQIIKTSHSFGHAYSLNRRHRIITMDDQKRQYISDSIRTVPDFPKKGIMFHDVTTMLLDPKVDMITHAHQVAFTKTFDDIGSITMPLW